MRTTCFAVPTAALLAAVALAACSNNATPSANNAATSTPSVVVASAVASGSPQAHACKLLAAMTFDASTVSKISTTQDQIVAALNLLPKHDRFGADVLAAEQDLVTLGFDLVGEENGDDTGTTPYKSDATTLKSALQMVESDCGTYGVPFTATLHTAH